MTCSPVIGRHQCVCTYDTRHAFGGHIQERQFLPLSAVPGNSEQLDGIEDIALGLPGLLEHTKSDGIQIDHEPEALISHEFVPGLSHAI